MLVHDMSYMFQCNENIHILIKQFKIATYIDNVTNI